MPPASSLCPSLGGAPRLAYYPPAMLADLVITSRRIVTPHDVISGAVVVMDGMIAEVVRDGDGPDARERLNAGDAAVLPGAVDTHVHVNEPGRTEWEGFESATRAAAAGGVTTIVDMPLNSVPVTTTVAALDAKAKAAKGCSLVDYGFWGGVVPGNAGDLRALVEAGVLGFKCFLVPSGIDEFPHVDERSLHHAMAILADFDTVLLVHAELPSPIEHTTRATEGADPRAYSTYLATRPPDSELDAIDLLIRLSGETGSATHVVHLSAADGATAIASARREGVSISVETCPHYLTFAVEDIAAGATAFKCTPPIRDAANRERLWQALRDDTIHMIASDHSPAPPELKHLDSGDFLCAWGGIASLQVALAATWTGAKSRGHTLGDLARWTAERPAALAGLGDRKGRIAVGYDGDLVLWDAEARFVVDANRLHHRHPVTPYAGWPLQGVVRHTFVRGVHVYDEGAFADARLGRRLTRGRS